jgi:radical SAM protein with 4Fe4S-binding SPASM domain
MKSIDVFNKYYSIHKLSKNNKYYSKKLENFNNAKFEYENYCWNIKSFPIRATIQTTQYCNLNCIMCQIHGDNSKRKLSQMKKDDFDIIVKSLFPYLVEIHPTNIGEALVSPWFNYFIEKVNEYGILLDLTTNGMLLNEEIILKILPNLLDIKISFDGIKKETFETIRKKSDFNLIKKNIEKLLELRKKTETQGTITLQMTILKNNYKELLQIIEYAALKGIDRVKAFHVFSYNESIKKLSLLNNLNEFEETRISAIKLAKKLDIDLEISEPNMKKVNLDNLIYQKCRLLWTESWIDTKGNFYPCHSHNNNNYGNIIEEGLEKVWHSKTLNELRSFQVINKPKGICYNCGMNYLKIDENQKVPYDIEGFISCNNVDNNQIRWSNRSKQFTLKK